MMSIDRLRRQGAACSLPGAGARLLAAGVAIGWERVVTAWAATRMEYEPTLTLVHVNLTEAEFRAEQAVEYAQSLPLKAVA